jgi:DNA adenine methylase
VNSHIKRPVLRWHGGKWMLAPWIISHFPAHRIYVEPFGGAASVLVRKDRSYAEVYNDLDDDVVNLFRVLRSADARHLVTALELTPFSRLEFMEAYAPCGDAVERARRLVIRSFMGFGSNGHARSTGFRANSNRSGTTPAHDWVNYSKSLPALIDRLAGVIIEHRQAAEVIRQHDSDQTLFYVDPPYVFSTRSDLTRDYAHEMSDADHVVLAGVLHEVAGMVVLSGYPSPLYQELYGQWHRVERAALADSAAPRTEVLWMNDAAVAGLSQQDMPLFEVLS